MSGTSASLICTTPPSPLASGQSVVGNADLLMTSPGMPLERTYAVTMARTCIQSALGRAQVPCASCWPGCGTRASRRTIAHWKGPRSARRFQHRVRAGVAAGPGSPAHRPGALEPDSRRAAGAPPAGAVSQQPQTGQADFPQGRAPKKGKKILRRRPATWRARRGAERPGGPPGGARRRLPACRNRKVATGSLRVPAAGPRPPRGPPLFQSK